MTVAVLLAYIASHTDRPTFLLGQQGSALLTDAVMIGTLERERSPAPKPSAAGHMHYSRDFSLISLLFIGVLTQAQTNSTQTGQARPALAQRPENLRASENLATLPERIDLTLSAGTPIRIALTQRVRLSREGTPVIGKVIDTVYAFDEPVIPTGSEARGKVVEIAPVSKLRRTEAAANADFSPGRDYVVGFESLVLPDGRTLPIHTTATQGTPETVHLVTEAARAKKKNLAAQAVASAKQEVHNKIHLASTEIKPPGRMRRVKQYLLAQMPYRRQYLEPGTRFIADLDQPLEFGSTARTRAQLASIGNEPEPGSTLRARLAAGITSADAHPGTPVEAVLTNPVFTSSHELLLPAGSRIVGQVTQARPARKLHRNGVLRMSFERITTPEGKQQEMKGALEGAEVDRTANLKLDEEGGARATDSKSRYISTALSISVAAVASHPESDNGEPDGFSDPATRTVAGGSGFKLLGALVSLASGSKTFSSVLGFYGAGFSVYRHFLARGKDVVFPKNTPLEIGLGLPHEKTPASRK
jgi:hypothetical protein